MCIYIYIYMYKIQILSSCNGKNTVEDILSQLVSEVQGSAEEEEWEGGGEEVTVQDVVDRLSRLYYECLLSY